MNFIGLITQCILKNGITTDKFSIIESYDLPEMPGEISQEIHIIATIIFYYTALAYTLMCLRHLAGTVREARRNP